MLPLFDDAGQVRRSRVMVALLILANVVCFLYELTCTDPNQLILGFSLVPVRITHGVVGSSAVQPVYLTLLTSLFLHGGWLHIGSNMLFLWIFGDEVEGMMGSFGFLVFYLLSGIIAGLVHSFMFPNSTVPTIGASGAIAGVLGAYIVRFPRARVMTWIGIFFLNLPAWLVLGYWAATQWFQGVTAIEGAARAASNVAVWAHVGGFLFGVLVGLGLYARRPDDEDHQPQYAFYHTRPPWQNRPGPGQPW